MYASGSLSQDEIDAVKEDVRTRGLAKLRFMVLVKNENNQTTMKAQFEWSILLKKENGNG